MTDDVVNSPEVVTAVESTPAVTQDSTPVVSDSAVSTESSESILGGVETAPTENSSEKVESPAEKPAEKPAEVPSAEANSSPAETPVETPVDITTEAIAPVYDDFKFPENFSADKEAIGEFAKLLGELETASGKMDHAGYQEAGQKLIDLGIKNVQQSIERLNESYSQIFEKQKKERLEMLKSDPVMGGENFSKTVSSLQRTIQEYGGTPEQVAQFRKEIIDTGLDASPAVARLIFNMQQKISKYESESDNGNGGSNRIVPGSKPAPSKSKDYQRFYGGGN